MINNDFIGVENMCTVDLKAEVLEPRVLRMLSVASEATSVPLRDQQECSQHRPPHSIFDTSNTVTCIKAALSGRPELAIAISEVDKAAVSGRLPLSLRAMTHCVSSSVPYFQLATQ